MEIIGIVLTILFSLFYILPVLGIWTIIIYFSIKERKDMEIWIVGLLFFLSMFPIINIVTLIILLYLKEK